jgi:hypothetical protein
VAIFRLITSHDWWLIYTDCRFIHPHCVSYVERKTIMNQYHLPKCTVLNTENTPIAKLYWDTRRQMEFLQVPEH